MIVNSTSIEVNRHSRRAKTDRRDVQKLAGLLVRHWDGEGCLRVVRVPPSGAEDERLLLCHLWKLKRTQ